MEASIEISLTVNGVALSRRVESRTSLVDFLRYELELTGSHVGHRAIRTRGTIGGSVALADPAAELPACLLALDARIRVAGPGTRRVHRLSRDG